MLSYTITNINLVYIIMKVSPENDLIYIDQATPYNIYMYIILLRCAL